MGDNFTWFPWNLYFSLVHETGSICPFKLLQTMCHPDCSHLPWAINSSSDRLDHSFLPGIVQKSRQLIQQQDLQAQVYSWGFLNEKRVYGRGWYIWAEPTPRRRGVRLISWPARGVSCWLVLNCMQGFIILQAAIPTLGNWFHRVHCNFLVVLAFELALWLLSICKSTLQAINILGIGVLHQSRQLQATWAWHRVSLAYLWILNQGSSDCDPLLLPTRKCVCGSITIGFQSHCG